MTENEAIEILREKYMDIEYYFVEHDCYREEYDAEFQEAMATAMKALNKIQQYQAIGTVERFQQLSEQFKPHVTGGDSCPERHCNKCDKYRKEIEKYHKIGTVDECREARGKQRKKKKVLDSYCGFNSYECPVCGAEPVNESNYCHKCGQRLG